MLLFHRPKAFKLSGICYQKVTKVEFEFSLQVAEHPLVSDIAVFVLKRNVKLQPTSRTSLLADIFTVAKNQLFHPTTVMQCYCTGWLQNRPLTAIS